MQRFGTKILFAALGLSLAACGGGGAKGGAGGSSVDETGTKILRKDGTAMNVTAHKRWGDAVEYFKKQDKRGWTKEACSSALDKFKAAEAAQAKFSEAIYMQGLVHYKCGDKKAAIGQYNKALRINSKLCKARVGLGLEQLEGGRSGRGEFERAIRDDPQCTEGYVNLAIVQRQEGNNVEALNNLRRALAIDAEFLPAFNEMALLYLGEAADNKKKLDLAEVVCSQAQKIDAEYAPIYNTWGLIDLRRNKIIEASAKFEKAFSLDGKMFEAYMNFAQITIGFRGYADAEKAFSKAIGLQPESFDAQVGLGVAYRGLEQNDKAIAAYEKAMKLQPRRAEPYYNLGVLWQDFQSGTKGDMAKAERYYKQFLNKAGSEPRYKVAVDDVTRRCKETKRRRGRRSKCIAGRLQNIENYRRALKEMEEMEKLQKEAERQAAELEAQEKAEAEAARKAAEEEAKQAQEEGDAAEGGGGAEGAGAGPKKGGKGK
ncbi:MAG: tetratricopeptide repeat protein [Myxococcales bacterium]|nr:tetratricopeptide repeat protein [Myxococcales bacterium]